MSDDSQQLNQDDIERLLQQTQAQRKDPPPAAAPPPAAEDAGNEALALDQAEIEALLSSARQAPRPADAPAEGRPASAATEQVAATPETRSAATKPAAAASRASQGGADTQLARGDVEFLLHQAEEALSSIDAPVEQSSIPAMPFRLREFGGAAPTTERATLDLLRDVDLDLKIELGRTQMYLEDVLKLRKGSVVALDKLAGDPVDIYVNGRLIARGEVLVLNDNFCVRVGELITGEAVKAG